LKKPGWAVFTLPRRPGLRRTGRPCRRYCSAR